MTKAETKAPLKFIIRPYLVQDLGLNLYTTLPSVLVEYLANSYDAEAKTASISIDFDAIEAERKKVKADYDLEVAKAKKIPDATASKAAHNAITPLAERFLPPSVQIVIEDNGNGMTRDDLADKYLVAGRRRREEDGNTRSESGTRLLMGRKGLGKLAGFGIAHTIELTTRRKGEAHATRITLSYEELLKFKSVSDPEVPEVTLADGGDIKTHGTRIVLTNLGYEATKNRSATVASDIADHFSSIKPADFEVRFAGNLITPTKRALRAAYPQPELPVDDLVEHTLATEEGEPMKFSYRIRFTEKSLPARQRGIRVYSHNRLASAPDTLELETGIHGFHNLQYLDGIVEADFIDEHPKHDYIATNRRTLRWEVGRLADLRAFLSEEMKSAISKFQALRDAENEADVEQDEETTNAIDRREMPKHRQKVARRIAKVLAAQFDEGTKSPEYRRQFEIFLNGLVQSDVIGALGKLAEKEHPNFRKTVEMICELTHREIADHMTYVEGRLKGIAALDKIVHDQSFKKGDNEDELHVLFEKCPWLIKPQFNEYVTSDASERTTLQQLAKTLEIGAHVKDNYKKDAPDEVAELGSNKRPDLVFLLGGQSAGRIVIVELKAPNTPLHVDHLLQLKGYMQTTEEWLKSHGATSDLSRLRVEGILLGCIDSKSTAAKVKQLRSFMDKEMESADWKVKDISELVEESKRVHARIWDVRQDLIARASDESIEDDGESTVIAAAPLPN